MAIFPNWVERYVGIPYKSHGRDPEEGLDCWGLVYVVYRNEFGVDLPKYDGGYEDAKNRKEAGDKIKGSLKTALELDQWVRVDLGELRNGDILIVDIVGIPCHIGMYCGRGHILHVREGTLTCIEDYESRSFAGNIREGYRYIGD